MREVAELAGVAMSSVSRVLSDHPDVSPPMRERVLAAVDELGYKPGRGDGASGGRLLDAADELRERSRPGRRARAPVPAAARGRADPLPRAERPLPAVELLEGL